MRSVKISLPIPSQAGPRERRENGDGRAPIIRNWMVYSMAPAAHTRSAGDFLFGGHTVMAREG